MSHVADNTTNIKMVVHNWIRYNKKTKKDIPSVVVSIIVSFCQILFWISNILSIEEDWKLAYLMDQQLEFRIKSYKSIFRSSDYDYSHPAFHQICGRDRDFPNLVIIKDKYGGIFGGFTSKSWKTDGFIVDPTAFLVMIRSDKPYAQRRVPLVFKLKEKGESAIFSTGSWGPTFGSGPLFDICVADKFNLSGAPLIINQGHPFYSISTSSLQLYHNKDYHDVGICGGNKIINGSLCSSKFQVFDLEDYEVYEITKK